MPEESTYLAHLRKQVEELKDSGLYKSERPISSPQAARITAEGRELINLCSNNYLGLSNHPRLVEAAKAALGKYGYGMSSVRFICGTQTIHEKLEMRLSSFLGTEATILYSSCFDANTGLFETLLGPQDAVISDSLNHASIIDGIRLCKAARYRYENGDMGSLRAQLEQAQSARFRLIATDGVFSMDGFAAKLPEICELAEDFDSLVMVDDSHAVGFMGPRGRGSHELFGVTEKIDVITGTLGKALGGASGGYVSGRKEIVEWLRQRSRPYLFSNSLAPVIAATSIAALDLLEESSELRERLFENSSFFRKEMQHLGFRLQPGEHPIIPVMIGDATLAKRMSDELLEEGVYVVGFSYPVVPKGQARIRTQMSSALTREDLEKALSAFRNVGRKLVLIN